MNVGILKVVSAFRIIMLLHSGVADKQGVHLSGSVQLEVPMYLYSVLGTLKWLGGGFFYADILCMLFFR